MSVSSPFNRNLARKYETPVHFSKSEFLQDFKNAIERPAHAISPKHLYDAVGSRLFDQICELPEYYPTRTERTILATRKREIADIVGQGGELVEFGAGSLSKVRLLLEELRPCRYVPIDISIDHLTAASDALRTEIPWLQVLPMGFDYTYLSELPRLEDGVRRVGFFPGSTIGNLSRDEALQFLQNAAVILRGGGLLLGVDLLKDPEVLHRAYNDSQGITAAFNLNLLSRANRELQANFDLNGWWHSACFNAAQRQIDMHLISRREQMVRLAGCEYLISEGFALHTESSRKFTSDDLSALATEAGFAPDAVWTDDQNLFSVYWLRSV